MVGCRQPRRRFSCRSWSRSLLSALQDWVSTNAPAQCGNYLSCSSTHRFGHWSCYCNPPSILQIPKINAGLGTTFTRCFHAWLFGEAFQAPRCLKFLPGVSTLGAPRNNAWLAAFANRGIGICLQDHDRFPRREFHRRISLMVKPFRVKKQYRQDF